MSLRIECVYVGERNALGFNTSVQRSAMAWVESPSSGVATTNVSPGPGSVLVLRANGGIPVYVAIGAAPNAGAEPRRYLAAGEVLAVAGAAGEKVAWVAA